MIKSIHLTNFRQHTDLKIEFQQGVTVLRGQNEAGKTTVFEAIGYALFGSRATRNSDLTTHGQPENSHQVSLVFEVSGQAYHIKRNARSAELNYDGGRVTGQNDTARFCEQLFGLPLQSAHRLMLIAQNEIRGVLSDTGAKTTQLMTQLANLHQIDDIIEKLQAGWHTGNTDVLQNTLDNQRIALADVQSSLNAANADLPNYQMECQRLQSDLATIATELSSANDAHRLASEAFQAAQQQEQKRSRLQQEHERVFAQIQANDSALNGADVVEVSEEMLADSETKLSAVEAAFAQWQDYKSLRDWQYVRPVSVTEAILRQGLETNLQKRSDLQVKIADLQAELRQITRQTSCDTHCPTCKRAFDDAAEREKAVAEAAQRKLTLQAEIVELEAHCEPLNAAISDLNAILNQPFPVIQPNSKWCFDATDVTFTPTLCWQGAISENDDEVTAQDVKVRQEAHEALRVKYATWLQHQKWVAQIKQNQIDLREQLAELETALKSMGVDEGNLQKLNQNLTAANEKLQELQQLHNATVQLLNTAEFNVKHLTSEVQRLTADEQRLSSSVQQLESELAEAAKAKALLKILRQLKPQITQQVWQTVCTTANHYFNTMRGKQSILSHRDGVFQVNGQDVQSLSGSTLDVLGLAIRIAMVKLFNPLSQFLMLDEPFASADIGRTELALSALVTAGFSQIIVITHEDTTEAVADHLITLS